MRRFTPTARANGRLAPWLLAALTAGALAALETVSPASTAWTAPQPSFVAPRAARESIRIDAVAVPLNPQAPSATAVGEFHYAGGLVLSSRQTDRLHELSGLVVTGRDRFAAVGDEGVLVEGRLVLDPSDRLIDIAEASLTLLTGPDGQPLTPPATDAEGLALLPGGDRLVSFERIPRIWLYPRDGGPPRAVPSPETAFGSNTGMEALTADPDTGADAYIVGAEDSGATWTCRVTAACVRGPTVEKPEEFGLVSMNRLPGGMTAYLLRAYDPIRGNRITLKILSETTVVARMDLAPPTTVDNFEAIASVVDASGQHRFYLLSDDNNNPSQRTLLLAFDWRPR